MDTDLTTWVLLGSLVAVIIIWISDDKIARSIDDGWLGEHIKKKKIENAMPEEPPFSLDKPNSCEHCKHNLCTGLTYICDAYYHMDKRIETWWWSKERSGFRTWDRCDDYEPLKICKTCKHGPIQNTITEMHTIGDEEVEVKRILTEVCPYKSECKHAEKWELKEEEK